MAKKPVKSATDKLADKLTTHQLNIERFKNGMEREAVELLRNLQEDITKQMIKRDPTSGRKDPRRVKALYKQTNMSIKDFYGEYTKILQGELFEIAKHEQDFITKTINDVIGIDVATVALSTTQLRELTKNTFIEGQSVKEIMNYLCEKNQRDVVKAVRMGVAQGETLDQMIRRIYDPDEKKPSNWTREIDAALRTGAQQALNDARMEVYKANSDIINAVEQMSTLDNRTTIQCMARDGLQWDMEGEPIGHTLPMKSLPLHWKCRSTFLSILLTYDELMGKKVGRITFNEEKFQQKLKDRLPIRKGESELDYNQRISAIHSDQRASMNGPVKTGPKSMTDFMKNNPQAAYETMGKTRAKAFLAKKITLRELVGQQGERLTLRELRERELL